MKSKKTAKSGIACSIFRKEIESLQKQQRVNIPFRYIGSMLHMNPELLDSCLKKVTEKESQKSDDIVLAFGDCCPNMNELETDKNIVRVCGLNCCEILLGSDLYRKLRAEGVFFLMPEWTLRWREVFQDNLGLEGDNARSFMRDMHTKLVYLDTGLSPIPESHLDEIAKYSGLPVEIMQVSLDHLVDAITGSGKR
jgi:hypothetical protein